MIRRARDNGQSHADVLVALVKDAQPGTTYTYADLIAALAPGTGRAWNVSLVQSAVRSSRRRLLRELQRTLAPVVNVGYRLATAAEHQRIGLAHGRKAQRQHQAQALVLQETRVEELTLPERVTHEQLLAITLQTCRAVNYLARRQRVQDDAIADLLTRVERLEVIS